VLGQSNGIVSTYTVEILSVSSILQDSSVQYQLVYHLTLGFFAYANERELFNSTFSAVFQADLTLFNDRTVHSPKNQSVIPCGIPVIGSNGTFIGIHGLNFGTKETQPVLSNQWTNDSNWAFDYLLFPLIFHVTMNHFNLPLSIKTNLMIQRMVLTNAPRVVQISDSFNLPSDCYTH